MRAFAEAESGASYARRGARRHRAAEKGLLSQIKLPPEPIAIINISTHGCGFESRWPFQAGTRVWLQLPGLEKWLAKVAWWDDGRGGLEFDQPLHPAVAERFARDIGVNDD
jgi:PilZ domain